MTQQHNTDQAPRLCCPSCQREITWTEDFPYRPFCSKRCQQSDFCGWANEENVIQGDRAYDDMFSEQGTPGHGHSIS